VQERPKPAAKKILGFLYFRAAGRVSPARKLSESSPLIRGTPPRQHPIGHGWQTQAHLPERIDAPSRRMTVDPLDVASRLTNGGASRTLTPCRTVTR